MDYRIFKRLVQQACIDVRHIEKHFDEEFSEELNNLMESIVLECAAVGSKAMYPDSDPDYVGRKIKEHFGMK